MLSFDLLAQTKSHFFGSQLFIIPLHNQVLDSNSQHRIDNNNHFTTKKSEKTRLIGLLTKTVAIYAGKKAGYYCQNNDQSGKLLFIGLNQ